MEVKALDLTEEQYKRLAVEIVSEMQKNAKDNSELRGLYQQEQKASMDALTAQVNPADREKRSIQFARMVKCMRMANGNPEKALAIAAGDGTNSAKGMYPFDKELHEQIKSMTVGTGSDGGFLVSEQMVESLIPYLYSGTILDKLGARKTPMPSGNLTLPRLKTPSTVSTVGEAASVTKTQPVLDQIKLSAKKVGMIVPISKDLIRSNSIAADMAVRDDIVQQIRLKLDYLALYGSGAANEPLGISNYAAGNVGALGYSTAITTSGGIAYADVVAVLGGYAENNPPDIAPGWAMNAKMWAKLLSLVSTTGGMPLFKDEMAQGTLFGIPYAKTNQITSAGASHYESNLFLCDWSELLWGIQADLEISMSEDGSFTDGGTTYNAFEYDLMLIKAISLCDFAPKHAASFACSLAYTA
jgi:HK97 family phage major capsid protein